MDQQDSTEPGKGKLAELKNKASKVFHGKGKDGSEQQQGTELRNLNNSRTNPSSTTYLPGPGVLPPLPTFQRPTPRTTLRTRRSRLDSPGPPEILDVSRLLYPARRRVTYVGSCGPGDRPEETPPLPKAWNREHDLSICYMDRCGIYLPEMVARLKSLDPELRGRLTTAMVDKRLRQLDQQPEIDYFRSIEIANRAQAAATPFDEKENVPTGQGTLRIRRSRAAMWPSTSSLRGLSQSQAGNSYPRLVERDEPTTPTRTSITAESRRRDAAIRSSRSRPHLKQE